MSWQVVRFCEASQNDGFWHGCALREQWPGSRDARSTWNRELHCRGVHQPSL